MKFASLMLLMLTTGCYSKLNLAGKNLEVSGSTCVDGLIVNIDAAGCESLYFGNLPDERILKVACKYSPVDNLWTRAEYYAIPFKHTLINPTWQLLCEDEYMKVYRVCCK